MWTGFLDNVWIRTVPLVLDDHTVQITLTQSYGGFLAILAATVTAIVDKDYVEENGGIVQGETNIWMKEHPMGTGPYMVKSTENTSEVLLTQNPLYWGGWDGNHVEKVFFKTTQDIGDRISALLYGVADFTSIPYDILWDVIGEEGIVYNPSIATMFHFLQSTRERVTMSF